MEDIFITDIHINKVRHLENVDIPLSKTERKHLILTGKNGSGKTSVLESLKSNIGLSLFDLSNKKSPLADVMGDNLLASITKFTENNIKISVSRGVNPDEIINKFKPIYFSAKRNLKFIESQGPTKIVFDEKSASKINTYFIQQLVNIRYELLEARVDEMILRANFLQNWMENFKNLLSKIYSDEKLVLNYDKENYNFFISLSENRKFNFNQLSDGFSSIIDIVSEILMNGGDKIVNSQFIQGIVLIDEIETHLHIDLQKKILPFLTSFFPKIQFIVTTHSPFVLMSEPNAVIFDLEKKERVEDLSGYSVEGIIESYFDSDQYSTQIKEKVTEYEKLLQKTDLTDAEKERRLDLKMYFKDNVPKTLSSEIKLKIKELEFENSVR